MTATINPSTLTETQYGLVRGFAKDTENVWLGIPYAAPPTGQNRWQPPQAPEPWDGVRECTRFGNMAPQPETALVPKIDGVSLGEDCLTLNIWAPNTDGAVSKPRPVMVWIHGGGYTVGGSAQPTYDGSALSQHGHVVVVTINYRLGALGFLDLGFLDNAERSFATNVGLRDIISALEWVRANIAAFGGDPNDVTVFGQSAGAACITTLMTTPSARGLFHRAIAQSPPATSVYTRDRAQGIARSYLERLGFSSSAEELTAQLFAASVRELVEPTMQLLYEIAHEEPGILALAPVVDGDLVPHHPIDVFERGEQHAVPLIIGSTHDEAKLFTMLKSPLMPTTTESIKRMFENLAREQPEQATDERKIVSAYPGWPNRNSAIAISSDAGIRMPVLWIAEAHAKVAPTFVYRFDQATPMLKLMGLGAIHASELAYVFGTIPHRAKLNKRQIVWLGGVRRAHRVSERLRTQWTTFATASQPNWPAYSHEQRQTLVMNRRDTVVPDPNRIQREAWGEQVTGFR